MIDTLSDINLLPSKSPQQWNAIRKWLHNGGTLIVFGAGDKWERIGELQQLLGLPATGIDETGDIDPTKFGWITPSRNEETGPPVSKSPEAASDESDNREDPATAPFVMQSAGFGTVVALRVDDSSTSSNTKSPDWNRLLISVGPQRWQWFQRYGLSMYRPNEDFWNFLIPGVGLAPVTQFQVIITAFVLAIGPLNYWLLKRRGALNLLVLTVPASALIVTAALVLFALFSDGLGVRVRARSFTHIDQKSGEAICWSRLSYYAGLAPGRGLTFAEDTVVLPLEFAPKGDNDAATREVDWKAIDASNLAGPLEQRLTAGWLNSRTPTQFVTSRIRKTSARIDVQRTAGQPPKFVNHLGAPIMRLIVADEDGKLFSAENLPAEAMASLIDVGGSKSALRQMLDVIVDNEPRRPDLMAGYKPRSFSGLNDPQTYGPNGYNPSSTYRMMPATNEPAPSMSTSILERSIAEVQKELESGKLKPRSYIALVENSPEMQLGTPSAKEEASLHLITGTW